MSLFLNEKIVINRNPEDVLDLLEKYINSGKHRSKILGFTYKLTIVDSYKKIFKISVPLSSGCWLYGQLFGEKDTEISLKLSPPLSIVLLIVNFWFLFILIIGDFFAIGIASILFPIVVSFLLIVSYYFEAKKFSSLIKSALGLKRNGH